MSFLLQGTGRQKQEVKKHLAAAAAKSLQSCVTLCDPIDSSPTRLPCPWDSPGKNTGVGCHCLLREIRNEAGQSLIEFCQENALVITNILFQQHKRRLYTWTSPDGKQQNQIDYILCSQRWRNSTQSAKARPGADCGSDHELLIAKFRLKLKKVRKTSRPFRYD